MFVCGFDCAPNWSVGTPLYCTQLFAPQTALSELQTVYTNVGVFLATQGFIDEFGELGIEAAPPDLFPPGAKTGSAQPVSEHHVQLVPVALLEGSHSALKMAGREEPECLEAHVRKAEILFFG